MVSLLTVTKAQYQLASHLKAKRLQQGLTQEGLAKRSGVSVSTLRKFEQKSVISLESFLKLLMVLGGLEAMVNTLKADEETFTTIEDVLKLNRKKPPKRGWRT